MGAGGAAAPTHQPINSTARSTTMTATKTAIAATTPKFMVRDEVFIANTTEGEVRIPLRFKGKILRKLAQLGELPGLYYLIDNACSEETQARLDDVDNIELAEVTAAFFKEFNKSMQATPGE
jgi:hypothetical protein